MSTFGRTSPPPHPRPVKRGRQRKSNTTTSHLNINSQLLEAISQEKTSVVRRLISSGADPNSCSTTCSGDPALMVAVSKPDGEARQVILDLLLTKGASVDAANRAGQTALMYAARAGDAELCAVLLDASASVGKEDCDGNTALSYAAENGNEDAVRVIVQAAKEQGCDIDHRNMKGLTALLLACRNSHLSAARILVQEGGASPSIRDLDNFMTAAELMKMSGDYLESDLKFLYPVSRKKSYYRQQRQAKGLKTLSDFLSPSGSIPNVFKTSDQEPIASEHDSVCLPRLSISPSPHAAPNSSSSMFDIPSTTSLPNPFRKKSHLPPPSLRGALSKPKLSFSHDYKLDLYRSRHLKQRQLYVTPNRQSNYFHAGSLQPLPGNPLERIHQATQAMEKRDTAGMQREGKRGGKHKTLPPLQRQNSQTSTH